MPSPFDDPLPDPLAADLEELFVFEDTDPVHHYAFSGLVRPLLALAGQTGNIPVLLKKLESVDWALQVGRMEEEDRLLADFLARQAPERKAAPGLCAGCLQVFPLAALYSGRQGNPFDPASRRLLYCQVCADRNWARWNEACRASCDCCGEALSLSDPSQRERLCYRCDTPARRHEYVRVAWNLYRASREGLAATLEPAIWFAVLARHRFACAYCQGPFEEMDHVVPIARGGGTTADNCLPSCSECNRLKGDKTLQDLADHPRFTAAARLLLPQ